MQLNRCLFALAWAITLSGAGALATADDASAQTLSDRAPSIVDVCDPNAECKTACDCEPGLACVRGECRPSHKRVFCCDSDVCPADAFCQDRHGEFDTCFDPKCEQRARRVAKTIDRWVRRASECEVASDCTQIGTSTGCGGTCGAYVNEKFFDPLSKKIRWLDERVCSTYQEDGCPFATPACLPTRAACIENRCVGVPLQPGPPRPRPIISDVDRLQDDRILDLEPRR